MALMTIQVENHFFEMNEDVWMSPHEKEREQEDVYTPTSPCVVRPLAWNARV